MPLPALEKFERNIGRQLRVLELRKQLIERKIADAEERDDGVKLGELYGVYAAAGGYDALSSRSVAPMRSRSAL